MIQSLFHVTFDDEFTFDYILQFLTGRVCSSATNSNYDEMAEHYNLFIGEFNSSNTSSDANIYSPKIHIDELKMVWITHNGIIGYYDNDGTSKFLFEKISTLHNVEIVDDKSLTETESNETNVTETDNNISSINFESMTIKDCKSYAKLQNIKIPYTITKKTDIIQFLLNTSNST
jgi:hypothetical protein